MHSLLTESYEPSATESKPFLSPAEKDGIDPIDSKPSLFCLFRHRLFSLQQWKLPLLFISAIILNLILGFLIGHFLRSRRPSSPSRDGLLCLTPFFRLRNELTYLLIFCSPPRSQNRNMATQPHLFTSSKSRIRGRMALNCTSRKRFYSPPRARTFHIRYSSLPPTTLSSMFILLLSPSRICPLTYAAQHAILIAYHAARSDTNEEPELFGTRIAPSHIRHCFDYLRRAIMCASDTNLEVVDRVKRTTNGWGQEKRCRDYGEVFRFAEKWANSSDTGITT